MDLTTLLAMTIGAIVFITTAGVGLIVVDGPLMLARDRGASPAAPQPPRASHTPLPFTPLDIPPTQLQWPSERAVESPPPPGLVWPSSRWTDPHFGAAARQQREAGTARANDAHDAADRVTANRRSAERKTAKGTPKAEPSPTNAAAETARRSAAPAPAPAAPGAPGDMNLDTADDVRAALEAHGVIPVVKVLRERNGWSAVEASRYLRKVLGLPGA